MNKIKKILERLLKSPLGTAFLGYVIFITGWPIITILFNPDRFLSDPCSEIVLGLKFGLFVILIIVSQEFIKHLKVKMTGRDPK